MWATTQAFFCFPYYNIKAMPIAYFRFYEELNDFLPPDLRKQTINHSFSGRPGIKDPIEAIGIPHSEIELIVVNDQSVGFDYQLKHNDRVAVYPMFESMDVSTLVRLRDKPLRKTAFVVDVNLGKLARYLRQCGFDTVYSNKYSDRDVVDTSLDEHRIILTRDRRLLFHKLITHGYWVRNVNPEDQLKEVIYRFDLLENIQPFHRCIECNGDIEPVPKDNVINQLEPLTRKYYKEFYRCLSCGKIYWKGSHYQHMLKRLDQLHHTS